MRIIISRIIDWAEDNVRSICAPMSPDRRVITIVVMLAVFAAVNFYVTFRAIYNIGREDARRESIEITQLDVPEFGLHDEEPTPLQQEMKDFFNEHFNSETDESTEE